MTPTTIWGTAKTLGELVAIRSVGGRVAGCYAIDNLEPILGGNAIDLDHDPTKTVGSIVYAELGREGQVGIVGVLDDDAITMITEPVFFSGTYTPKSGRDPKQHNFVIESAWLTGVSLTLTPATGASAWPVRWRIGDVRNPVDRSGWPMSWKSDAPILERAAGHMSGRTRDRAANRFVDRRDTGDFPWGKLPASAWRATSDRDREHASGQLRHSPHAGRIISVRSRERTLAQA